MYGEMAQRIPETMEHAFKGGDDAPAVAAIFETVIDEVIYMVARSIEWTSEEVEERLTMDDLLLLANAVWDLNIAGPAEKTAGLLGRVMGTLGAPAALRPQKPASSSPSTS